MLPIALRCNGRRALLVGGGDVALRKAETLLEAGLILYVVAPDIDVRLRALVDARSGRCIERRYAAGDIEGADLVIAATDDDAVNAAVIDDARAARVLACDASDARRGDFTMQATVRVGDLTFSIDSGGSTPAFAMRLAHEVSERFGAQYGGAARTLARMRVYARTVLNRDERAAVMRRMAERPIDELAKMNPAEAEHEVEEMVARIRTIGGRSETQAFVCATRGSALAITQSRYVAARLAEHGVASTMLNVTTTGDRVQDRPVAAIGSVNVWVKELELALRDGRAHYAVHSCKDLPAVLPPDMALAAISRREDARDAFCSERFERFEELPSGAVVGTSSLRRRAFLQAQRPDLRYEDVRGNVDTRLRKLREGKYDAIVLAMAGLNRLDARATHTVPFEPDSIVPAVGQGALAVETLAEKGDVAASLHEAINDERTEICVTAERAALRELRAGCNAPLGIHARVVDERLTVNSAYAVMGRNVVLRESVATDVNLRAARDAGIELAKKLTAALERERPKLVVLPRTQHHPSRIAAELRARGMEVVELRDGEPGPDPDDRVPDLLIFPSSGSVDAARTYLQALRRYERRPRVAAMGPQSGAAARDAGFEPDIISGEASIDAFVAMIAEQLDR